MKRKMILIMNLFLLSLILSFNVQLSFAERFVDNGDGTVTDTKTGLMWQQADDGTPRNWRDALAYCESLPLGNHDDWRAPRIDEIETIINYAASSPASFDPPFDTNLYLSYWSSSTLVGTLAPWGVDFMNGAADPSNGMSSYYVRCVRGGPFWPFDPSTDFQTPEGKPDVVLDTWWGYMWQKGDSGELKNWEDANTYCDTLSLDGGGWRLPEIEALVTIVNYATRNPALSQIFYPQRAYYYWSSSTDVTGDAWTVDFYFGYVYAGYKTYYNNYVRCVRSGPGPGSLVPLTLSKSGTGTGRVTSDPTRIDCGTSCPTQSANFAELTQLTLTAQADVGSRFVGWSGGGCSGTGTCAFTMGTDPVTVTAVFEPQVVDPNYTPSGSNVPVQPEDSTTGTSPITITFGNVGTPGETTLTTTTSHQGPSLPSGLKLGNPGIFFDINTTAVFIGSVTICIDYTNMAFKGNENNLELYHLNSVTGKWDPVTTSLDTNLNQICGMVTSLSPFVVVEPHPTADAGDNLLIFSEDQDKTTVGGTAAPYERLHLSYRWLEGTTDLSGCVGVPCLEVGTNGEAPLHLANIPTLGIGQHTLTLQVTDGVLTDEDTVIITVGNSAPHAEPSGGGTYQVNAPVALSGQVSDYDGDLLSYEWLEGNVVLGGGDIQTVIEGQPVSLPDLTLSALKVGTHALTLTVSDEVNDPVSKGIIVNIIDTTAPALAPVADKSILWPPNQKMVSVTIKANASDNSGLPVALKASVTSNEPQNPQGDWTQPVADEVAGTIKLQLRADRLGKGNGRQYTIAITATDQHGNASTVNVEILVPHDQGKN